MGTVWPSETVASIPDPTVAGMADRSGRTPGVPVLRPAGGAVPERDVGPAGTRQVTEVALRGRSGDAQQGRDVGGGHRCIARAQGLRDQARRLRRPTLRHGALDEVALV